MVGYIIGSKKGWGYLGEKISVSPCYSEDILRAHQIRHVLRSQPSGMLEAPGWCLHRSEVNDVGSPGFGVVRWETLPVLCAFATECVMRRRISLDPIIPPQYIVWIQSWMGSPSGIMDFLTKRFFSYVNGSSVLEWVISNHFLVGRIPPWSTHIVSWYISSYTWELCVSASRSNKTICLVQGA